MLPPKFCLYRMIYNIEMYDYVLIYCSSKLVSLILNMIKNSESYLNQLVDVKAFQLIGYLLEKVNLNITNTVNHGKIRWAKNLWF